MLEISDQALETLRGSLREKGLDLFSYDANFLKRRIAIRIGQLRLESMADYQKACEGDAKEIGELALAVSVDLTYFFRDRAMTDEVMHPLLDSLMAAKGSNEGAPLSIWCAGCSTGQEAYTIAMIVDRYAAVRHRQIPFIVHATDLMAQHVATAKEALYPKEKLSQAPPIYVERYFEAAGNQTKICEAIRRTVKFSQSDVTVPPIIQKADLILCRNVMIYFTAPAKNRVVKVLHDALAEHGILILGNSELVLNRELFAVVDGNNKIYRKAISKPGLDSGARGR